MSFLSKSMSLIFSTMLIGLTVGCGSKTEEDLKVFPVSGQILIDGVPPARAEIRFCPKSPLQDPLNRSVEPYAIVQADGTFKVATYRMDDGAPPGEYLLTIVWPTITVEGGEDVIGQDRLNGRYSRTTAPIASFSVVEGENRVPPIDLRM